jgi:hypothetical protein
MQHSSRTRFESRYPRIWRLASVAALTGASGAVANGCADNDRTILIEDGSALTAEGRTGSGATASTPEGSSPAGSSGANGASVETGAEGGECVPDRCPTANLLGAPAPGCCQEDGACGALVALGGFSFCAPSVFGALAPTMGDGAPMMGIGGVPTAGGTNASLPELGPETVVVDPLCPSQALFGAEFAGCCDQTGVCGLSSQPFASGGPFALPGLEVPLTCIAAGDVPLEVLPFLPPEASAVALRCGDAGSAQGTAIGESDPGPSNGDGVGKPDSADVGDGNAAPFPAREIIAAFLEVLLDRLTAILDAADDGSSEDDDIEDGSGDEDGEVGADAGVSAGG